MPPPELPSTFYNEQQQILRDIRDELRAERTGGTTAAVGGMPGSSMPGRPSNNFVKSQMMADKVLNDQWHSLAWANAYSPAVKSSITGDVMGAFGISVAPNTMTQAEFQAYASQSLSLRGNTMMRSILAPMSTNRVNTAADELAQMSSRFIRAGDAGAGMFGIGMDIAAARQVERGLETESISNMRLNFSDYNTIQSTGLRSGQFDFAEGTNGFITKMRELTTATADLTRVTRMSVDQISQSMGALRQMGVGDVAEQSRIIQQTAAAARVAGVTPAEMSQQVNQSIQAGLPLGLSAGASADLASSNMVMVRNLSRSGLVSTEMLAAGGGAGGVASSIRAAQQQFMASQGGYLASLGGMGEGVDYFAALGQGLGTSGGTFQGMLGMQANRMDYMQQMTAQETAAAHRNMLQSQMRMMGVTDFTSTEARNLAFSMTRGTMGEAAANAYARANFSDVGLYNQALGDFNTFRDTASRQRANEASRDFEMTGGASGYRRAMISVRRGLNTAANWMGGVFGFDDADVESQMRIAAMGGGNASVAQMAAASLGGQRALTPGQTLVGSGIGDGWGALGGLGGMAVGALAGNAVVPGIGGVIGGIAGAIGGATWFADDKANQYTLNTESAKTYGSIQSSLGTLDEKYATRVKRLLKGGGNTKSGTSLGASTSFRKFVAKADRSDMHTSPAETMAFMKEAEAVARETGEDVETIIGAARASGMDIKMAGAFGTYDPDVGASDNLKALGAGMGDDFNITQGTTAAAVKQYAQALKTGKGVVQAQGALAEAGITGGKIEQLRENLQSNNTGFWGDIMRGGGGPTLLDSGIVAELGGVEEFAGRQSLGNLLSDAVGFAGQTVRGNAAAERELQSIGTDKIRFLEMLEGKTGAGGAELRQALGSNKLFGDVIKMSTMSNLTTMGARDLAGRFVGLSEQAAQEAKDAAGGDEEKMRRILGLTMLQSQNVENVGGFDAAAKTAGIQRSTADILIRLAARLDVDTEGLN